jgi:hypothetical protein
MSLRDEGIYSTGNVLLYVAEAVLKHTMSHDHSHFYQYFFFSFFYSAETPTCLGGGSFSGCDMRCGGDTFFDFCWGVNLGSSKRNV